MHQRPRHHRWPFLLSSSRRFYRTVPRAIFSFAPIFSAIAGASNELPGKPCIKAYEGLVASPAMDGEATGYLLSGFGNLDGHGMATVAVFYYCRKETMQWHTTFRRTARCRQDSTAERWHQHGACLADADTNHCLRRTMTCRIPR